MAEQDLNLEECSAEVTLTDVYAMFYLLVKQNQKIHPGSKMSFELNAFKILPKKVSVNFLRKCGRLFAWVPEKRKSKIIKPEHKIVTIN